MHFQTTVFWVQRYLVSALECHKCFIQEIDQDLNDQWLHSMNTKWMELSIKSPKECSDSHDDSGINVDKAER